MNQSVAWTYVKYHSHRNVCIKEFVKVNEMGQGGGGWHRLLGYIYILYLARLIGTLMNYCLAKGRKYKIKEQKWDRENR